MPAEQPTTGTAPYPLAMVVCDGFWRDPYTGKHTLIGTFSAIGGPNFPVVHPIVTVYVALTDGRGKTLLKLQLTDLDDEHAPIFELEQEVDFTDARMMCEICFQAGGVTFPSPGEYRLKLFANGEFVIERS